MSNCYVGGGHAEFGIESCDSSEAVNRLTIVNKFNPNHTWALTVITRSYIAPVSILGPISVPSGPCFLLPRLMRSPTIVPANRIINRPHSGERAIASALYVSDRSKRHQKPNQAWTERLGF
jgi:hypothetical protein